MLNPTFSIRHMAVMAAVAVAMSAAPIVASAAWQAPVASDGPAVPAVEPRPVAGPAPTAPINLSARYVLGIGDELTIHVIDVPEISGRPQRVDPDGNLRLAMIGQVSAAGMTVGALEDELKKRLGVYLRRPDVTVTVTSARSQNVSVMGAVASPGLKPLDHGKTLMDVLSSAGGLASDAGPTVRVVRKSDQGRIPLKDAVDDAENGFSVVELDARALLDGRTPEKNIAILPNDIVAVPRAEVVYVIGEVGRPGEIRLGASHSLTVMEAVSSSGGVLKTAAPNKVRILRKVAGQGERTEINVDLQRMMQGKAKDVPLATGDILVVPDSTGKRVAARVLEGAISVGTMIATYGIIR